MFKTSHTAEETIQQNPIHIDSKWFKNIIELTGSMEEAILLADTMIYHHNRYKSFKIGNENLYGLVYSAKEYQKSLHISYHKARELPKQLVEKGLLEAHSKKMMCNRTFYTPTKQALENIYKIHFSAAKADDTKGKPLVQIRTTACSDSHNPYKDKYKDKNNNNPNSLLKYNSLLGNSKAQNVKTVIFNFKKFNLANIQCEANILDYFTVKQSEVINTIVFCHNDKLDIMVFNQILNRLDVKKEAKDFRQLVSWAYFEAVKNNNSIVENNTVNHNDVSVEISNEVTALNKNKPLVKDDDRAKSTVLPDVTSSDIQAMINEKKQQPETKTATQSAENTQSPVSVPEKTKTTATSSLHYLLTPSNQLDLIANLSGQGINDATLILKTAENIIAEYDNLSFNKLLDGVVYRLVTLPEKQRQQERINQVVPMPIESETDGAIDALDESKKTIEQTSEIDKETMPDFLNQANQTLLLGGLNAAGVEDKKLIFDTAKDIITEYPDLSFQDLLQAVIYRLVKLPEKRKKKDKIHHSMMAEFNNIADSQVLKKTGIVAANQSKSTQGDAPLPELSDLAIPYADKYLLRQDWAKKADQHFYTGILPDSQKLALLSMIHYVKRKGINITIDQEVYEWLYHMASNQKYYYSRAKNFKHWCNIVMNQLIQSRLHKPKGFDSWRNLIESNSLAIAA